jgi:hypothetical protein
LAQGRALAMPLLRTIARYPGLRVRLATRRRGTGGIDLDTLQVPNSRLAKDAEAEAREMLSPHVLEHSYLERVDNPAPERQVGEARALLAGLAPGLRGVADDVWGGRFWAPDQVEFRSGRQARRAFNRAQ